MKVHFLLRFELEDRQALAYHFGKTNPVGAAEARTWAEGVIRSSLELIRSEYNAKEQSGSDS